jgi:hypothetical protein
MFLGAHPPNPLGGGCAPSTPFPTPVGLGFAGVLDPTRGENAILARIFPFPRREGGQGLGRKGTPSWLPFAHPRGLRVCQRSGAHSWRVKLSPDPAFARIPPPSQEKRPRDLCSLDLHLLQGESRSLPYRLSLVFYCKALANGGGLSASPFCDIVTAKW